MFGLMQQPIIQAIRHHRIVVSLMYLNPTEPFNLYLMVALVLGLFAASPFVFYQFWLFIAPELYRTEKRYVIPYLNQHGGIIPCRSTVRLQGGLSGLPDFLIGYVEPFQPMITISYSPKLFPPTL